MVAEGEALGLDWREVWERVKDEVRKRRPEPGKPGQPLPQLPKVPGPPTWLVIAAALYLAWLWDR